MLSAGPIYHGNLHWQTFILDLSLIDLLLIFHMDVSFCPVVCLGVESTIKLLSGYGTFSPVSWCHFDYIKDRLSLLSATRSHRDYIYILGSHKKNGILQCQEIFW